MSTRVISIGDGQSADAVNPTLTLVARVAVGGSVLNALGGGATHGPAFLSGMRAALLVCGTVELIGMAVAFFGVRNPVQDHSGESGRSDAGDEPGRSEESGTAKGVGHRYVTARN